MRSYFCAMLSLAILLANPNPTKGQAPLTPEELLKLKTISMVHLSPVNREVIYSVSTPRGANDKPGGATRQYFRASLENWIPTPLFENQAKASSPRYSPNGKYIGFLLANEGETQQVWVMNSTGGKIKKLTNEPSGVSQFKWQPGKNGIAYLSRAMTSEREKELKERGYNFIFYEENLKNSSLHMARFDEEWNQTSVWQMTHEGNTWDFEFNRQGDRIAASISPKNLIDHRYMFRKIFLIDINSGEMKQVSENEGKLGNYAFSPDGRHLAYAAALNINDSQVSQAYVVNLSSGAVSKLTPPDFRGHISWVNWKDSENLLYLAGEGVYPTLSVVPVSGGTREVILNAADHGFIFGSPLFTPNFKHFVFSASTPEDRSNLYYWDGKSDPRKVTAQNPWLKEKVLGKQELISYQARDGQEIEGILIHPVDYKKGSTYPLIVYVHGGPEHHNYNAWLTRYSTPGQVMSGKGYFVFYPNYRASTGYGVNFAMEGYGDPAGKEFDDIADGIDNLVKEGLVEKDRVGLAGGSYGGYASGWFATYYTKYVKAVCMFVGISDLISKQGTTDIAYEDMYVHMGKPLEEMWDISLKRSPIYWAHQSKTAVLIYGGAADTRVHPSQSMELYRRLKVNNHPAVRLVQYPGEGHGNAKQPGQIDVLYRQIQWLDWYVRDKKSLDGPMPALDISESYGLDLENDK